MYCRSEIASQVSGAIALSVTTKFKTLPLAATGAMLVLASMGCTQPRGVASSPFATTAPKQDVPAAPEWWREAGDPVLATLVQQGLAFNQEITCRVSGLRRYDLQVAQEAKRIGARLDRLLGADQKAPAEARAHAREERVQRVVVRRAHLARQIALAYVEVRRLQEEVTLRSGLRYQYKDNAEVAQFRREAGLVSAIDGALARSQDQAAEGELGFAQSRLSDAISQLAGMIGDTPEALAGELGTPGTILTSPIDPLATADPGNPRRAALADDVAREARLAKALEDARRTVRDARGAYRQGAGEFATLYVAEAAVTAVNLAFVNARASRVMATLDLWSEQDPAWARKGLAPTVAAEPPAKDETITVTADCD
jgi:outer membrane protein TolC